jgi:hypothetical protein
VHAVAERCSFNEHLTFDSSCFRWQAAVAERLVAPFCRRFGCLHESKATKAGTKI